MPDLQLDMTKAWPRQSTSGQQLRAALAGDGFNLGEIVRANGSKPISFLSNVAEPICALATEYARGDGTGFPGPTVAEFPQFFPDRDRPNDWADPIGLPNRRLGG